MKKNNLFFLLLVLLLTTPALFGIFHEGFFLSDDGNWMVIRFSAFYENLRGGQFPVRFLSRLNNGFGYPVADFLYPLFMYIGAPIHLLKFSFVDTIKIIFALSFISSSFFSFLWLKKNFTNISSLVGAIAYTFFPYHLWDMYKRGSLGEVLALGIVPFILWAIEIKNLALIGLGYGLLILAHNSLALLFIPVLFVYQLLGLEKDKFLNSIKGLVLGLMISCFFWLPALYDKQFTVFDKTLVSDFSKHFVSDFNLFGVISVVALIGSLSALKIKNKKLIYFLGIFVLSAFLSTSFSRIIWEYLPIVSFIQFPFRIMSIFSLAVAYLISYHLENIKDDFKKPTSIAIFIVIFFSAFTYLFPRQYQHYPDTFYSTNQDSTTVKNEYMPKWVKEIPSEMENGKVEVIDGSEKLKISSLSVNKIIFQGEFEQKRIIQINTVYFPGWEIEIDGKQTQIDYNSNGLIRFSVPKGNHVVASEFKETNLRKVANSISVVGVFLAVFLIGRKKINKL